MMQLDFTISHIPNTKVQAMCIGKFDGIHLGHEALLHKCKQIAGNSVSSVLTFHPLPFVFFGQKELLIYTEEEKQEIIKQYGIDVLLRLQFNEELMQLDGEAFLKKISHITGNIIVGEDFRFGHKQGWNANDIVQMQEKFGYKAHIVEKVSNMQDKVSSTHLKSCILSADFPLYNTISSIPFHVNGIVVPGMQMAGKILGFPTANIVIPENKIMPQFGVYKTLTEIDGVMHKSISNYGIKPTVSKEKKPLLETHILDFDQNLYGKKIKIVFIQKIREEKKFDDINQLKFQISKDIQSY